MRFLTSPSLSLYSRLSSFSFEGHPSTRNRFRYATNLGVERTSTHEEGETQRTAAMINASSETQAQSVGSGEKAGRKFSSTGERTPGYRLSPNYFQKFQRLPSPDWAQTMLCIIVLNQRTFSPEFFS